MKHIILEDFEKVKDLESDSLGDLTLVKNKKTEKNYVFRRIDKKILLPEVDLENEVAPFFRLQHKTVLRYVGSCSDGSDALILATKFVDGVSLQQVLNDHLLDSDTTLKYKVIFGIAEGMRYLHENRIIHGDLRPSNILIDTSTMNPMITDFGLLKNSSLLERKPLYKPKEDEFSFNSDVFAFSMIVYQILSGKIPYNNKQNVRERIDSGERPALLDIFTPSIDEWLTAMWSPDPSKRPSFSSMVIQLLKNELLLSDGVVSIPKLQSYMCTTIHSEFATRYLLRILNSNPSSNTTAGSFSTALESIEKSSAINMSPGLETEGIIARLTQENGGNVHEQGVVTVSGNYFDDEQRQKLGGVVQLNWDDCYKSGNQKESWLQFNFFHRKVTINKYSIKTWNGQYGHLTQWKLEGSNDAKSWKVIDQKSNVTQLCAPGKSCVFRCKEVDSFNLIKITQTGQNSSGEDVINVTNVEFYGTIR